MTSVGRGRGWATSKNRDTVLRRPGPVVSEKNSHYLNLIEEIDGIDIYCPIPMSKIDGVEALFRLCARDKGFRDVFNVLHTQALEDRQFGIRLAKLFSYNKISDLQVEDGTKLRTVLINVLQTDYEKKDEVKENCMTHYLNAMSLHGEVYYQVRLSTGEPIRILGVPLLDYMKALLQSASEEDIELVATQLSLNGKSIHASNRVELERFLIHVRTVLVNRNLSSQSRAMLLLAVDLANQLYAPLSGDLQAFYLAQLGEETMMQLQRYQSVKSTIKPKEKSNVSASPRGVSYDNDQKELINTADSGIGIAPKPSVDKSMKYEVPQKVYEQNLSGTINSSSGNSSHASLPRAIRGLGIRENRKENPGDRKVKGKKDRLTDEQVWSSKQNNSSKSWGHDDRFERDYEQDKSNAAPVDSKSENSQFSDEPDWQSK